MGKLSNREIVLVIIVIFLVIPYFWNSKYSDLPQSGELISPKIVSEAVCSEVATKEGWARETLTSETGVSKKGLSIVVYQNENINKRLILVTVGFDGKVVDYRELPKAEN